MDLRCRHCGEPWDVFHLTDTPRAELLADGFQLGRSKHHVLTCPCCLGDGERWAGAEVVGALQDVLGDDIDGIAAELSDLGL